MRRRFPEYSRNATAKRRNIFLKKTPNSSTTIRQTSPWEAVFLSPLVPFHFQTRAERQHNYTPSSQNNKKCLRGKARRPWPHPRRPWKPLVTFLVQSTGTYYRRCRSLHWAIVKPARWLSCQASRAATSRSDCERKNKKSIAPATYYSV